MKRGSILLVEDEEELRCLILEILLAEGYNVIQAGHGLEGLKKLAELKNDISLIITDMVMPHLEGEQLIQEFEKMKGPIPIIYMSGNFSQPLPGNFLYLEKPFTDESLVNKIKEALAIP